MAAGQSKIRLHAARGWGWGGRFSFRELALLLFFVLSPDPPLQPEVPVSCMAPRSGVLSYILTLSCTWPLVGTGWSQQRLWRRLVSPLATPGKRGGGRERGLTSSFVISAKGSGYPGFVLRKNKAEFKIERDRSFWTVVSVLLAHPDPVFTGDGSGSYKALRKIAPDKRVASLKRKVNISQNSIFFFLLPKNYISSKQKWNSGHCF